MGIYKFIHRLFQERYQCSIYVVIGESCELGFKKGRNRKDAEWVACAFTKNHEAEKFATAATEWSRAKWEAKEAPVSPYDSQYQREAQRYFGFCADVRYIVKCIQLNKKGI